MFFPLKNKNKQLHVVGQHFTQNKNRFWQTFFICGIAATIIFLPYYIIDGGFFRYAGDFNSQQITFYQYLNGFVKNGGTFSWETDLGSGALNAYSFYLYGSPFFWFSAIFPQSWLPYLMVPLLVLKFAVAGGGAYLYLKRYAKNHDYAVIAACLYALSGFAIYNVFFNHFVDVVALFPYLMWALDRTIYDNKYGQFAFWIAINFLNNNFFFIGQVLFICIYFICKLCSKTFKLTPKLFAKLAIETLLGAGMGALIAIPGFLSLLENPRSIDLSSGYGFLMYSTVQQYFAILLSWILPPDSPYITSLWSEGVIKWTSMTAYLPLCSLAAVIAYWKTRGATWIKRVLLTCAIFALVPVLNSAFYALNSSYYARWYYMPVLILSTASMIAFEDEKVKFGGATAKLGIIMLATLAFAVVPVFDSKEETWSIGVLQNVGQYVEVLFFGVAGLLVFAWVNKYWRGNEKYAKILLIAVFSFAVAFGMVHIGVGKFAQWEGDKGLDEQYHGAQNLSEKLPEGSYRVDTYNCYDNLGPWLGKSNLQFFNSTVAPSILEFYPSVGVKRDVSSKPELDKYALRSLLGVKYTIMPQWEEENFLAEEIKGWELLMYEEDFAIYENQNYLPIGFAYDYYVTQEQFDTVSANSRANLLLSAVMLSQEQIEALQDNDLTLKPLPEDDLTGLNYDRYVEDVAECQTRVVDSFEMTNTGFTAKTSYDKTELLFFAVPYDEGFSAQINGVNAEVLKVNNGLMAVVCPEGENEIVFSYAPYGFAESKILFAVCAVLFALYLIYSTFKVKAKPKHKEHK